MNPPPNLAARFSPVAERRGSAATTSKANAVREKESRIVERAQAHFEKQREGWITKRYHQLLKQDAPAPSLQPRGAVEDRSARLMRAAAHLVDRRQEARIHRIRSAAEHMIGGKRRSQLER